ncbi:hypothetical protein HY792_02850 [Candidatus Desantisbacteria bacterium]|nr:hypothetical protein [Candidatus Desantisbacteria bacterium]
MVYYKNDAEDLVDGKEPSPYWRIVKSDGSLNKKFPDGAKWQTIRLIEESHTIEPGKGNTKFRIQNTEGRILHTECVHF